MSRTKFAVALTIAVLACGKSDDGGADAMSDAASGCTWPNSEGGTIHCAAKTSCPSGDDCNTCSCNVDGTRGGCTTLVCP